MEDLCGNQNVKSENDFLKLLLLLGIDYVRWTQIVPMLLVWGIALLMLLTLTGLNFQEQAGFVIENTFQWLMQMPYVGEYIVNNFTEGDKLKFNASNVKPLMVRGWIVISLVFMLVSMLVSFMFGPFKLWSLKRKFFYMTICTLLLFAGLMFNYFAGNEVYNGSMAGWMINFSLIPIFVFLVSVYSLTVTHLLGLLSTAMLTEPVEQVI